MTQVTLPIGVYDSGFGGLTILRELRRALPQHDFVYLGDAGRAPYGGRDTNVLLDFAEQCTERLFEEGARLIVVACHTVSSVALRHLQRRYARPGSDRRILGVTIPAAEAAVAQSAGHIGFVGTARTVASGTFATEVAKLSRRHRVTQHAAPLLASIVEEGLEGAEIAHLAAAHYLAPLSNVDTLVLGCTHYPLLRGAFEAVLPPAVALLDPAPMVAARLVDWLSRHEGFAGPGRGALRVLSTGDPAAFVAHGPRFLGAELPALEHVAEHDGRLEHKTRPEVAEGQIVR
jgi:glutamate racemase